MFIVGTCRRRASLRDTEQNNDASRSLRTPLLEAFTLWCYSSHLGRHLVVVRPTNDDHTRWVCIDDLCWPATRYGNGLRPPTVPIRRSANGFCHRSDPPSLRTSSSHRTQSVSLPD